MIIGDITITGTPIGDGMMKEILDALAMAVKVYVETAAAAAGATN